MASTNKTTNYELSQFVGTDKPAWLADYNSDMSKIDTAIKSASDSATVADGKADNNATAIGTLANLNTTAKTDLVSSVNEVVGNVTTAQNTANSASTAANTANTNINKFNLTQRSTLSASTTLGTIYAPLTNVQFATDTTSSVYKVYGRIYIQNLAGVSGTTDIVVGETSLRPTSSYEINSAVIMYRMYTNNTSDVAPRNLTIETDGKVKIKNFDVNGSVDSLSFVLPPCLYFNTDFGDE